MTSRWKSYTRIFGAAKCESHERVWLIERPRNAERRVAGLGVQPESERENTMNSIANLPIRSNSDKLANGWPASWIADDPDADATSPQAVYEAALRYVDRGLSVIPVDAYSGDKSPDPQ